MRAAPSTAADPRQLAAELRERINPAYADTLGTESHERRLCAEAIESLLDQRDELLAALEPFADIQHYALAPDGAGFAMRSNGEAVTYGQIRTAKTLIAKVKQ